MNVGERQARIERLRRAIGPDHADSVDPDEHVAAVMRMIEHRPWHPDDAFDPPASRAAAVPRELENPQIAGAA